MAGTLLLLVEDNVGDARLVREALTDARVDSDLAVVADGEAALDYLYRSGKHRDARRPDVIFLDLNLPRRDGHAVLRQIKADPSLRSIPVVILSSSDQPADIAAAYAAHANCYLRKPVQLDQFLAEVGLCGRFWLQHATLPGAA